MKVLNIGGGSKSIPIPDEYKDWEHYILDQTVEADYRYDIIEIIDNQEDLVLPMFDAVYMSHVLEHFHPYQVAQILMLIKFKLLEEEGYVEIKVPDIRAVMVDYINNRESIAHPIYELSNKETISTLDIMYGHQKAIREGRYNMMHKCAFDKITLDAVLNLCGFYNIEWLEPTSLFELHCKAYANPKRGRETT